MDNGDSRACFFTRGKGPLVSVLIPSRGAPDLLRRAVTSCVKTAKDPGNIEFLIRADEDDKETVVVANHLVWEYPSSVEVLVGPRGRGYYEIHNHLNEMAAQARGDWLFIINDDSVMLSQDWDYNLYRLVLQGCWVPCPQDTMLVWPRVLGGDDQFIGHRDFFFLRRKTYEILGCVCQSPYGDTWLSHVCNLVGCGGLVGAITLKHDRDPGREREREGCYREGAETLHSTTAGLGKIAACARLLGHMEQYDSARNWYNGPGPTGWYRWRQGPDYGAVHTYIDPRGLAYLIWDGEASTCQADKVGGLWQPRDIPNG